MQPLRLILLSGWGIGQRIWQPLEAHWPACLAAQAVDWPGYGDTPPLEVNAKGGVTSAELSAFQRAFQRDPTATWQHFLRWQTQGEPGPGKFTGNCVIYWAIHRLPTAPPWLPAYTGWQPLIIAHA